MSPARIGGTRAVQATAGLTSTSLSGRVNRQAHSSSGSCAAGRWHPSRSTPRATHPCRAERHAQASLLP